MQKIALEEMLSRKATLAALHARLSTLAATALR